MNVTCKLFVQNRKVTVEVVPSATALLIKALKEPPRDRKKVKNIAHDGNISWEDVFSVAKAMRERSNAKEFKGTVLEVLGRARQCLLSSHRRLLSRHRWRCQLCAAARPRSARPSSPSRPPQTRLPRTCSTSGAMTSC